MALSLTDCTFLGPALPEPFVRFQLEDKLRKRKLLPSATGEEGRRLQANWEFVRRKLRDLGGTGGERRVAQHVLEPLVEPLGYARIERVESVATREGEEDGGFVLAAGDGERTLRAWSVPVGTDLDAPNRRGRAYRFSPSRVASRVLAAKAERVGLLTDGQELRLILQDPARPDSHVSISLDRAGGWRGARNTPDSFRLLCALASPAGTALLPELVEDARLAQTSVTKKLRRQARLAVETFVQEVLDYPANEEFRDEWARDHEKLAKELWREGLILVYRLLFVMKLESAPDPARAFSFASTPLWRSSWSPNTALAPIVREVKDQGAETGSFLEESLRALFRLFAEGLSSSELHVTPLGGMLFGKTATPLLNDVVWGERAVANLLDHLLWTDEGGADRQRVHYGTLDVEDLGRVYESLLELEPGIATEDMCRLKRAKLEVVVPSAQGERYRTDAAATDPDGEEEDDAEEESESETPARRGGTKVQWIEPIPAGRFFLRVGLGRKASGSYYTPHPFVRFLVQETLGPQIAERSPSNDPNPAGILALKVLDPAMGSGHFLVEACRYLGDALYEACRLCDELALEAEAQAATKSDRIERETLLLRAAELRARVERLPDPNNELLAYLPSRASEGESSGYSQAKALALCRRLVAVHSLYGVDKNPLAVELAKLALWLESYAEGLPLTFLDHRLVLGDSLTGPFASDLMTWPKEGRPMDDLFAQGLAKRLSGALAEALSAVRGLEASVGTDLADLEHKRASKEQLDRALSPLRALAAAWSGGVMLGDDGDDAAYERLVRAVVDGRPLDDLLASTEDPESRLGGMLRVGRESCAYDLAFPEVFHPGGTAERTGGFDAVLGNPPWQGLDTSISEFFGGYDPGILDLSDDRERGARIEMLLADGRVHRTHQEYVSRTSSQLRSLQRLYQSVNQAAEGESAATPDIWQAFAERALVIRARRGFVGVVLPSGFHANAGAAGLRDRYLREGSLRACYSFENRRQLFEIHASYKYALVVQAGAPEPTRTFACAFYIQHTDWLFGDRGDSELEYTPEFLRATTGDSLNFLELRSRRAVPVAEALYRGSTERFGVLRRRWGVLPSEELHTSKQRHRTRPLTELAPGIVGDPRDAEVAERLRERGVIPICKGEHFHHYDARWGEAPTLGTTASLMQGKERSLRAASHYRLALRRQASSTNERTVIVNVVQPGLLFLDSAVVETRPWERPTWRSLALMGLCASFPFDWLVRQLVAANVTFNFLDTVPVPTFDRNDPATRASVHFAVRLAATHAGYAALWTEILGNRWHEAGPSHTWPAVIPASDRLSIRARIDALVAAKYGLTRDQYESLLSGFSHASYPAAPALCLESFEEIERNGIETFCRRQDPYFDVPLPESLPEPVLALHVASESDSASVVRERTGQTSFVAPDFGPLFRGRDSSPAERTEASATSSRTASPGRTGVPDETHAALVALLVARTVLTSRDAQTELGLTAAELRPHFQRLVQEGLAIQEGQRRGTRYRRANRG